MCRHTDSTSPVVTTGSHPGVTRCAAMMCFIVLAWRFRTCPNEQVYTKRAAPSRVKAASLGTDPMTGSGDPMRSVL